MRCCVRIVLLTAAMVAMAHEVEAQLIIAHRGASHDAPENTLAAFRLAFEQDADGVEGDFYLSADGEVVCIHDADTERVAGVKHVVKDTSFEVLRSLDVGSWKGEEYKGERIPTLEEVLAVIPDDKQFFIELKIGPEIVGPMLEILDAAKFPLERTVVISFKEATIAECERRRPAIKTYWLVRYEQDKAGVWKPTREEVLARLKKSRADGLDTQGEMKVVTQDFLDHLCDEGFCDFAVWTIDKPKVAQHFRRLGAKAITTNRPGWLRSQIEQVRSTVGAGSPQ